MRVQRIIEPLCGTNYKVYRSILFDMVSNIGANSDSDYNNRHKSCSGLN